MNVFNVKYFTKCFIWPVLYVSSFVCVCKPNALTYYVNIIISLHIMNWYNAHFPVSCGIPDFRSEKGREFYAVYIMWSFKLYSHKICTLSLQFIIH